VLPSVQAQGGDRAMAAPGKEGHRPAGMARKAVKFLLAVQVSGLGGYRNLIVQ